MTPFLQLRLWWLRAPSGDRVAATLAAAVVVALAGWVLVPANSDSTEVQASGPAAGPATTVPGETASTGPAGTVATGGGGSSGGAQQNGSSTGAGGSTAGGGSTSGGGSTGGTGASGSRCQSTPDGAPGVSDRSVTVAFSLLDLAGPIGNSAANQASADDQQRMVQALVDDVNARGGFACRSVSPKYYRLNPISPDQGRGGCLQIIEARPAVVADLGGFAFPQGAYNCIPQQKIPLLTVSLIQTSEVKRFAPYLASPAADLGTVMRITGVGLKVTGWFSASNGFKKLGLLYDECSPEVNKQLDDAIAKAGITAAKISKYTFACPDNGFASPAEMAQAASQHRAAGVTHVIPLTGGGSFKPYTEAAERQGFRPKYAVTDYQGMPITAASSLRPNIDNFDGAVDMSTARFGMQTTPGFPIDAMTKRCMSVATKAGLPQSIVYQGGGGSCSAVWTLEAAFKYATALTPDAILPGLFRAGTVRLPYPLSDSVFRAPLKLYGGDSWAPIKWSKSCSCWRITERTRRSSL